MVRQDWASGSNDEIYLTSVYSLDRMHARQASKNILEFRFPEVTALASPTSPLLR